MVSAAFFLIIPVPLQLYAPAREEKVGKCMASPPPHAALEFDVSRTCASLAARLDSELRSLAALSGKSWEPDSVQLLSRGGRKLREDRESLERASALRSQELSIRSVSYAAAAVRHDGAASAIYKTELAAVHSELVASRDECERLTRQLRFARDSEAVASQCWPGNGAPLLRSHRRIRLGLISAPPRRSRSRRGARARGAPRQGRGGAANRPARDIRGAAEAPRCGGDAGGRLASPFAPFSRALLTI